MSMGPTPFVSGIAAGAPLAQIKGSDVERARQDTIHQQRQIDPSPDVAEIGTPDGRNTRAEERDADGRRLWEPPDESAPRRDPADEERHSRDPSGERGGELDLSG